MGEVVEAIGIETREGHGTMKKISSIAALGALALTVGCDVVRKAQDDGRTLKCIGTEPFWSLELFPDEKATFSEIAANGIYSQNLVYLQSSQNPPYPLSADTVFFMVDGMQGTIRPEQCSDGMVSDAFPYSISIALRGVMGAGANSYTPLTGCCAYADDFPNEP